MANLICNPGEKIWSKVKKKNKENLSRGENFDICCSVVFDWHCQKLISGRKTGF